MNPEAQRIAIAEVCGWQLKSHEDARHAYLKPPGRLSVTFKRNVAISALPDYPASLDAMHIAEEVLTDKQHSEYRGKLVEICGSLADALCATATQRAEAFLRVLGKWRD